MTRWKTQPLGDHQNLSQFSCGIGSLDIWLRTQAVRANRGDTARTYVWTEPGSLAVVAYYAIAPTQIRREELSRSMTGGISVVPGYLLARSAIDRSLQGRGLGGQLLRDALEVIVAAANQAAGRLIVVDGIDDAAAAFYRHYDFRPVAGDPRRLVMKITTARQALSPTDAQPNDPGVARVLNINAPGG